MILGCINPKTALGMGAKPIGDAQQLAHAANRAPSRGATHATPPCARGQRGIGMLPLWVARPEARRLCHVSTG